MTLETANQILGFLDVLVILLLFFQVHQLRKETNLQKELNSERYRYLNNRADSLYHLIYAVKEELENGEDKDS